MKKPEKEQCLKDLKVKALYEGLKAKHKEIKQTIGWQYTNEPKDFWIKATNLLHGVQNWMAYPWEQRGVQVDT